jgi:outer membrane protein OmpA-like peptidoglycan-associated protein
LSEQRANAVRQYLLANMDDLGTTTITAVGYGETVPLANNETNEGRTRNRRIDLLITPNLAMLTASLGNR